MLLNIQCLRAFAALNVVFLHIIETSGSYGQGVYVFEVLRGWGASGVDVFFVISGFVMYYTNVTKPKSAQGFLYNRFIRIVPMYWLLTAVLFAFVLSAPGVFRSLNLESEHTILSFLFLSKPVLDRNPLLFVGWTLEWEILFYLLFAIGIFLRCRHMSFWFPTMVLVVLVVVTGKNLIALEFILGMLSAKVFMWAALSTRMATIIGFLGLGLLGLSIFIPVEWDRLFLWGIPAFLMVTGAAAAPQISLQWLTFLGAASYSIYLIQVFTIPAFYKISSLVPGVVNHDLLALVCLLASALFGCAVYQWVERPITRGFKTLTAPR